MFRFRIDAVWIQGSEVPQNHERPLTMIWGRLECGSVRLGDQIAIPMEDGSVSVRKVVPILTFAENHDRAAVGESPLDFCFGFIEHLRGIAIGGDAVDAATGENE